MKRFRQPLKTTIKIILALLMFLSTLTTTPTYASAQSFYFSEANFDYTLSQNPDGTSRAQVTEILTAVFPDSNQNHGIERCIPNYYRGVQSLDTTSFIIKRNNITEPYSTYADSSELCLRIGSANTYVHGSQTYEISYLMNNVILQPDDSNNQEFYWDANGTGWTQTFNNVTATIHLSEGLATNFTGNTACFVGLYGTTNSNRCTVKANDDTITFSVSTLTAGETLTFDLEFAPSTFTVPAAQPNYTIYILFGVIIILWAVGIFLTLKIRSTLHDKIAKAKDKANPVQYIPPKNLTVAESGTLYLKSKNSLYVATLMELAVTRKIALERGEKKWGSYTWKVHIKDTNLTEDQKLTLEILNRAKPVSTGDIIEIKRSNYSSAINALGEKFKKHLDAALRAKKFYEPKDAKAPTRKYTTALGIALTLHVFIAFGAFVLLDTAAFTSDSDKVPLVAAMFSILGYIILAAIVFSNAHTYNRITMAGIATSRYLDGLKEYMNLAEKERLAFLHSVDGADVSSQGIVKLYEKLLPYAVLFGIEKSWLSELNRYYEMESVSDPDWVMGAALFTYTDLHSFSGYTNSAIASSMHSSGDSSGSSGFSGGGFAGGGGGGGGGGGW